jgi:predicted GNAT family acetyltransferase
MDIRHEPESGRFVAKLDGAEALLEYTLRGDHVRDYRHTFVPPALRGQGVAKDLVLYALDDARAQGVKIIPSCPYVAKVVSENAEYADLVASQA